MQFHFISRKKIAVSAILIIAFSNLVFAPSANAAEKGWRYWGYYQSAPGKMQWSYAQTGPTTVVADGSVEGWAFTFSGDTVPDAAKPRVVPSFKYLCGKTKAVAGKKRIGLVIDFGSAFLRPTDEKTPAIIKSCIVTDTKSIGADVLAAAAKIRAEASGMICGINGYPAKECGIEVDTPKALLPKKKQ
jgi:hypothetical protein